MTLVLLSVWSCVILFAAMVNNKFKWTRLNRESLSLFIALGAISPFVAAFFASWLIRETPLHIQSPDVWNRVTAFFLIAGLGEELFKMSACLIAVMIMLLRSRIIRPSVVILGCVCVALMFASIENTFSYMSRVDALVMLKRSYLAVPLHACMGFIHGICINRSLRSSSIVPLMVGYWVTVFFHTLYDVMDEVVVFALETVGMGEIVPHLELPVELVYGPIVFPLVFWMIMRWRKVDEREDLAVSGGVMQ